MEMIGTQGNGIERAGEGLGWLAGLLPQALRERWNQVCGRAPMRRMQLVEVLPLGGKRQLMIVVCEGQRYLVGVGGDSVQSITPMATGARSDLAAAESLGLRSNLLPFEAAGVARSQ